MAVQPKLGTSYDGTAALNTQFNIATLRAEDINWEDETISYARRKTGNMCVVHFGKEIA